MNGRCHKDALDRAEDICELCGHQFCAQCVLYPRGRRNPPTCKSCALENSGLRGTSGKSQPISKREYKKRKKALLEVLERIEAEQPVLEPFELRDPSAFDHSTELDRRIEKLEAEKPVDILAVDDQEQEEPPEPTPPPPAPAPEPPTAPSPSSRIEEAVTGMAPVDTSVNPLALEFPSRPAPAAPAPAPAAAVTPEPASAAELLARLKADQPIQSQFHQSAPALDADPFAAAAPAPAPIDDPFAATAPASTPAPTPAPVTGQPAFGAAPAPAPAAPQPKSGVWSPPAPPPRGTVLDGDAAPLAPSPTPAPAPTPPPVPSEPAAAQAEPETPKRRSADTDETGQWIPPSLRGMAAPDEREPLPKRR